MKRMFFKQIAGILCCSGMLSAHAAKVAPAASWDAKPGDTAMTYQANGSKIKGSCTLTEFRTFKQGNKNVHAAYFPKFKVQRRRLKSVMLDLIYIACKRTRHSGYIFLKFGKHCPWSDVFRQLHIKYC